MPIGCQLEKNREQTDGDDSDGEGDDDQVKRVFASSILWSVIGFLNSCI